MEKPRGARLLHRLLVLYQRVAGYQLSIVCIFLRIRFKKSWQTLCLFMLVYVRGAFSGLCSGLCRYDLYFFHVW